MSYKHPVNSTERSAKEFHEANPHVWKEFSRLMWFACARRQLVSARMVWEVMRWNLDFQTTGNPPNPDDVTRTLKLNNNHCAYFARWFAEAFPGQAHKIHFRRIKFDLDRFVLTPPPDEVHDRISK